MLVKNILSSAHQENDRVQTSYPNMSIRECANLMKFKNIGALPVLEEGILVGIITERDLAFKIVTKNISSLTARVGTYMSANPITVTPLSNLSECLDLMEQNHIRHLPVLDNGKLVGIISLRDVLVTLFRDQSLLAEQLTRFIHP